MTWSSNPQLWREDSAVTAAPGGARVWREDWPSEGAAGPQAKAEPALETSGEDPQAQEDPAFDQPDPASSAASSYDDATSDDGTSTDPSPCASCDHSDGPDDSADPTSQPTTTEETATDTSSREASHDDAALDD